MILIYFIYTVRNSYTYNLTAYRDNAAINTANQTNLRSCKYRFSKYNLFTSKEQTFRIYLNCNTSIVSVLTYEFNPNSYYATRPYFEYIFCTRYYWISMVLEQPRGWHMYQKFCYSRRSVSCLHWFQCILMTQFFALAIIVFGWRNSCIDPSCIRV